MFSVILEENFTIRSWGIMHDNSFNAIKSLRRNDNAQNSPNIQKLIKFFLQTSLLVQLMRASSRHETDDVSHNGANGSYEFREHDYIAFDEY